MGEARLNLVGRKSVAFMVLGLVAFILYLWFFVGFNGLFSLLSKLNAYQYTMFFSLAVISLFLAVVFDSLIWHSLLSSLSVKVKLRKIVLYNWVGNFVELIIPSATVGGEIARIALAQKETNHDAGIAAGTVIGSRLISMFVYSGGLLAGFSLLLFTHQLPIYLITPVILVAAGTAGILAIVFLFAFKQSVGEKIVGLSLWIGRRFTKNPTKLQGLHDKLQHSINSFGEVFRTFKANPRYLIKPVMYAIVAWLFNVIVYLMVFYSLNFTGISLLDLATVYCIVTTVETLTAGFPVGAVEVTMTSMFSLFGVPIIIAGAATTLTRLLTFWSQILVGYIIAEWLGVKSLLKGNLASVLLIKPPTLLREETIP
jgi:uncharacterized protein (TIRG00374 family)